MKILKKFKCSDGTTITCAKGKKSKNDFKIFTTFPYATFPHSLEYIGMVLRLKAHVEDINYPPPKKGRKMLFDFIKECMFNERKTSTLR